MTNMEKGDTWTIFLTNKGNIFKGGNIANLKKCEQAISMHVLDNVRNVLVLRKVSK